MSQAKVEQHKLEKANRKKIMAREKAKSLAARICAWAILLVIVGWAGYTGVQYFVDKQPARTIYTDTSAISDYMSGLSTEAE